MGIWLADRALNLDIGRVVAAIFVIAIHTNPLADLSSLADTVYVDWISRLAVPFFFAVTGYYLSLRNASDLFAILRRVLWLHLLWSTLYLLGTGFPDLGWQKIFYLRYVIGFWQLWYLPALAEGVVLLWLLRWMPWRIQGPVVSLIFATGCGFEIWCNLYGLSMNHYRNGLFFALPFLWLGISLRERPDALRWGLPGQFRWNWQWSVLAGWGLGFILLRLALRSDALSKIAPFNVLQFTFLLSLFPITSAIVQILSGPGPRVRSPYLARLSSGIFFTHVGVILVIDALADLGSLSRYLVVILLSGILSSLIYLSGDRLKML